LAVTLFSLALIPGTLIPKISGSLRVGLVAIPDGSRVTMRLSHEPIASLRAPVEDAAFRTKSFRLNHLRALGESPEEESLSVNGRVAVQRFKSGGVRTLILWTRCAEQWCAIAVDERPAGRSNAKSG
jgi:hypothetical protein